MGTPTQQSKQLLQETCFVSLSLNESAKSDGMKTVRVRGEFAKCGVATENKRVYGRKLWEKEIGRLDKAMKDRRVFGEADHPADGRTSLQRVSHLVTKLEVDDNGLVIGEAEILPTDAGRNLAALLSSGCKVGVSSRGYGTTKQNDKGEDVVQEDYKLATFDFVADPADSDAYPTIHMESTGNRRIFEGVDMSAESASTPDPADLPESDAELEKRFEAELLKQMSKVRSDLRTEIKAELSKDLDLAGAKGVLEQIKAILRPAMLDADSTAVVAQKDAEIATLKKEHLDFDLQIKTLKLENEKLVTTLKQLGFKVWMEQTMGQDPDIALIKKMVGPVEDYQDLEALQKKVEEVRTDLQTKREDAKAVAEARAAEAEKIASAQQALIEAAKSQAVAEAQKLSEENTKLQTALEKSLQANKIQATKLYAENRLANHPKATQLRKLIERVQPRDTESVDEILETARTPRRDADELDTIRSRVRAQVNSGEEYPLDEGSKGTTIRESAGAFDGLGLPKPGEFYKLAGVKEK